MTDGRTAGERDRDDRPANGRSGTGDDGPPTRDPLIDAHYAMLADDAPDIAMDRRLLTAAREAVQGSAAPAAATAPAVSAASAAHDAPTAPAAVPPRRTVGRRPAPPVHWLRRWAVPMSVAATLVLSVGLVTTALRERHEPTLESTDAPAAVAPQSVPQPQRQVLPPPATPPRPPAAAPTAPTAAAPTGPTAPAADARGDRSLAQPPGRSRDTAAGTEAGERRSAKSERADSADDPVDPADWLRAIESQLERGQVDGARDALKRFRLRHPGYRVPPALQQRLDP